MTEATPKFRLDFSNRVIEHLGIKLYQNKPSNVIVEYVSNSWDADSTKVFIKVKPINHVSGAEITVIDNGRGMTRKEICENFLVIGQNRRSKPDEKTNGARLPMGRKGIGKLAGFGIARTVDVISVPNYKLRRSEAAASNGEVSTDEKAALYWIRFDLDKMVGDKQTTYEPEVIADGLPVSEIQALFSGEDSATLYKEFLKEVSDGGGGVCVRLYDTTLKKSLNIDDLLTAIGRRFTVTVLRADFSVYINEVKVTEAHALPPLQDFRVGAYDAPVVATLELEGKSREVRYWAGFVSLPDAQWSIENAGVGVYAHGKIAQDRPFFFGIKGKEIYSRYLYAVIEADWLDELPEDVVSTDRRSLDWDTDETSKFYEWGYSLVRSWINSFIASKQSQAREQSKKRVREVAPNLKLTGVEEDALADLLGEILAPLGNDEDAKNDATFKMKQAWVHEPTRKLTQRLWSDVFRSHSDVPGVFVDLVEKLRENLVPETLDLAVTMAQRIAAITAMRKMIDSEMTETHLQKLVQQFPWLLGRHWEKLTANQEIKTLVMDKQKPDIEAGGWFLPKKQGELKPDFVFLADESSPRQLVIFEIKGPECGKTLLIEEYRQLRNYIEIVSDVYASEQFTVRGVLVGHAKGGFKVDETLIHVTTWIDVLTEARFAHVEYLAALLKAARPGESDARLEQIADFGGAETMEMLKALGEVTRFPTIVTETLPDLS